MDFIGLLLLGGALIFILFWLTPFIQDFRGFVTSPPGREDGTAQPAQPHPASSDVPPPPTREAELHAEILRLRDLGKTVVAERDRLKSLLEKERRERHKVEAELSTARSAASSTPGSDAKKFREAKAAFARLYHPDQHKGGLIDAVVRSEIFKEFWAELEKIEKTNN